MTMKERGESPDRNSHTRREKEQKQCIHLDLNVEAIEIDLSPPRLIRVVGRTSKGGSVERHMKVTDRERLVMV